MDTFVVEVPDRGDKEAWNEFQELMDAQQDAWCAEIQKLATELSIPDSLAADLMYLRTRSRHSYETEKRMINCYRATGKSDFRAGAGEEEEELEKAGF